MARDALSLGEARRIALAAQGLDRRRPARVDARHLRRAIRQLGLLQIDFVNVLVPAHYQVLFSRLGPYPRERLDDVVYRSGSFTEQWAHEASILPIESWPLLRHRMETHAARSPGVASLMRREAEYVGAALEAVRTRGPLVAAELPEPGAGAQRSAGAWRRSFQRVALEAHFGRGALAVTDRRPNFARVYDLAERVIPAQHRSRRVERADAQRELLRLAARAHGVGSATDLADYYRMPVKDARPRLAELVEAGELRSVSVEGWREPAYLEARARLPRSIGAATLLSPFDPVVWFRPRIARLFDFDYRVEIFVPRPQRRWGYYVLPFLLGERLVARVDLKADRGAGKLRVLAAYHEPCARSRDVVGPLKRELETMARWLDLASVGVARRGNLAAPLGRAVRA